MEKLQFQTEDEKYSLLWNNNYNPANWQRLAQKLVENEEKGRIIDFGFGEGSAIDYFIKNRFQVEGIEISSYAIKKQRDKGIIVHHSSLDHIPSIQDKSFEFGFCNDVIEHLPQNAIIPTLNEMKRICSGKIYLSVCPTPSHHLSDNGENLHLTVKPKEWWENEFKKIGQIEQIRFWFSRSLRYQIKINNF